MIRCFCGNLYTDLKSPANYKKSGANNIINILL